MQDINEQILEKEALEDLKNVSNVVKLVHYFKITEQPIINLKFF